MIEARRYDEARRALESRLAEHPEDGQARFVLGLAYHKEKRYSTALTHFAEAARLEPDYPLTYYFAGWAHFYLGDMGSARASFMEHLEFTPDEPDTIFGLGVIDYDEDKLDDAERRFRKSIELQRQRRRAREVAKGLTRLADVHVRRKQLDEALGALEEAVQLFPNHYEAWYKVYNVRLRLGDEEGAKKALEEHRRAKLRVRPGTAFPE